MQPIPLEPGMRVRCVRADHYANKLVDGGTYRIERSGGFLSVGMVNLVGMPGYHFTASRFKPIIRVKMRAMPSLDILLARALRTFDKMSPAEKDAHIRAQRAPMALARNMD
jgi:hypothetical protein